MDTNIILQGNALEILRTLPDESIHCVVTSPPYWALRDYKTKPQIWDADISCEHEWGEKIVKKGLTGGRNSYLQSFQESSKDADEKLKGYVPDTESLFCIKCKAWKGNLGLEPTFDLFIKHLCDIFDEIKRVLRFDGSVYVNMGDSYSGNSGKRNGWTDNKMGFDKEEAIDKGVCLTNKTKLEYSLPQKCLCQIPSRFAIEMTNRGWILRNKIIWHKPACMPSSASDRFTIDFEEIFFFVKNKSYYFEQQYEPMKRQWSDSIGGSLGGYGNMWHADSQIIQGGRKDGKGKPSLPNPLGRNKRCVWSINTKPFKEAHFATFPESLIESPIKASCPDFICKKCGITRTKIYENPFKFEWNKEKEYVAKYNSKYVEESIIHNQLGSLGAYRNFLRESGYPEETVRIFKGYSDCGCNAGFELGIVLDPFMGAGTTALVALKLNRKFLGIELSPEYIKIAEARIKPFLVQTKLPNLNVQEAGTNE